MIYVADLKILVSYRYIINIKKFQKNLRTTASVKLFNFQDTTQKSDFGTCCERQCLIY